MTTDEVLKIVEDRGMKIILKDGHPLVVKPKNNPYYTGALVKVLTRHREAIILELTRREAQ